METKHHSFKVIRPGQSTLVVGLTFFLLSVIAHPAIKWIAGIWPAVKVWDIIFYFIVLCLSLVVGKLINKVLHRRSLGEVDLYIHDDTVTLKWIRKIPFRRCQDLTFRLKDVRNYSLSEEGMPSSFRITLNDGASVNFEPMTARDKAFLDFATEIRQAIAHYNSTHQAHPVRIRQSIYRRKAGLLISAGLLLSFAALPFFIARIPTTSRLFWIPVSVYYFIAVLFILGTAVTRLVNMGSKNETAIG